jgi:hypothetical protein
MVIEIVDLPIENCDFPVMLVSQRVTYILFTIFGEIGYTTQVSDFLFLQNVTGGASCKLGL